MPYAQRVVELNLMQASAVLANTKLKIPNITIEAARGTGKSTVIGWFIKEAVKQMPRSTGVIVGETFIQIKARTLPSTKEGMEMWGLYEGIDYVVGRCGKDLGFEMPFQSPDSWSNVIHFSNGALRWTQHDGFLPHILSNHCVNFINFYLSFFLISVTDCDLSCEVIRWITSAMA